MTEQKKWVIKPQGDADEFVLITEDNHWVIALRMNGELSYEAESLIGRRIVASVNACRGLDLHELEAYQRADWLSEGMKVLALKQKLRNVSKGLTKLGEFLRRVRHWEEGTPDLHDTKESVQVMLKEVEE